MLNKSFGDVQIFITPDPKIVPEDLKPKFELSLIDFKKRGRSKPLVGTSEAEDKIVRMRSIDFYSNINRLSLNELRKGGFKLPGKTKGATITHLELQQNEQN